MFDRMKYQPLPGQHHPDALDKQEREALEKQLQVKTPAPSASDQTAIQMLQSKWNEFKNKLQDSQPLVFEKLSKEVGELDGLMSGRQSAVVQTQTTAPKNTSEAPDLYYRGTCYR